MDRVAGLDQGADDYVETIRNRRNPCKITALFRRLQMEEQSRVVKQTRVEYRDLVVEVENRVVRRRKSLI